MQIRQLQAVLAERDENLRAANLDKARLEVEAEGFAQRIRALEESERRYKEENWKLKIEVDDLLAQVRAAANRDLTPTQGLSAAHTDKSTVQVPPEAHAKERESKVNFFFVLTISPSLSPSTLSASPFSSC